MVAQLNWEPVEAPIYLANGQPVPDRKAIMRSDNGAYLATVGDGYEVFGNAELLSLLESAAAGADGVSLQSVQTIKGGREVIAKLALPGRQLVQVGDECLSHVLARTTHDGSGRLTLSGPYITRLVCTNGMRRTSEAMATVSIRHTAEMRTQLKSAAATIAQAVRGALEWQHEAEALARVSLPTSRVREYFQTVFPAPVPLKPAAPVNVDGASLLDSIIGAQSANREIVGELLAGDRKAQERAERKHAALLQTILAIYHNPRNAGGFGDTAWTAFNAVAEYVDHNRSTRGADDTDRADNRLASILWGSGAEIKDRAWSAALALA
jgi:phage/plasmid-like protein (TIGR03299 family)